MIEFRVNGKSHSFDGDEETPLLWYLRDEAGLTGTKFGCGAALCGACTVHQDGEAIRACITPVSAVADSDITTIEGLKETGSHEALFSAWIDNQTPQCGYCQPGQIMQAAALLNDNPQPTDDDINDVMWGNICRCGTYQRIRAAIHQAAGDGKAEG